MTGLPSISEVLNTTAKPSQKTAAEQSKRFAFATGQEPDAIQLQLEDGQEDNLRQKAASSELQNNLHVRAGVVNEIIKGANKLGRPLSPEEQQILSNAPFADAVDPQTVLESKWAEKYLSTVVAGGKGDLIQKSLDGNPDYTNAQLDVAGGIVAKAEVTRQLREKINDKKEAQGFGQTAVDFASSTFVPFRESLGVGGALGLDTLDNLTLPGTGIQEKIQTLLSNPSLSDFKAQLTTIIDELSDSNVFVAEALLDLIDDQHSGQAFELNVWNGLEAVLSAADVIGAGAVIKGAGKLTAKQTKKAVQDAAKAASNSKGTPVPKDVLNAVGDVENAATARSLQQIKQAFKSGATQYNEVLKQTEFVPEKMPTMYRWDAVIKGTDNLSHVRANAMVREFSQLTDELTSGLVETQSVRRRTDDIIIELQEKAQKKLRTKYDGSKASILDVSFRSVSPSAPAKKRGFFQTESSLEKSIKDTEFTSRRQALQDFNTSATPFWKVDPVTNEPISIINDFEVYWKQTQKLERDTFNDLKTKLSQQQTGPRKSGRVSTQLNDNKKVRVGSTRNPFRFVDQSETAENLGRVYTTLGDRDMKGWKIPELARSYAKNILRIPVGNFEIKQRGQHFFIETFQDLDESLTPADLPSILRNPDTTTPISFTNTFIGFLRNPADVLPHFQSVQRDVATFASSEVLRVMKDQAELIPKRLGKKDREELVRALEALKGYENALTGEVGRFAEDAFDFENTFAAANNGKFPSESQTEAYFRAILINDFEHFARNLQLRKDKARLGMEQVTIAGLGPDKLKFELEGKLLDQLPETDVDYGLAIWDNSVAGSKPTYIRRASEGWSETKAAVDSAVEDGYKIIQLAAPDQMPLERGLGIDDTVEFMLVRDADLAPLSMKQLNYNPGFHKIHRDPFNVKQTIVHTSKMTGRKFIRGDKSVINASSEAEAKAQGKMFEELRVAFNDESREVFDRVAIRMARDPDEMWAKFKKGLDDPADQGGLSSSVPFVFVRAGNRTQDNELIKKMISDQGLKDSIDSPFNLYRNVQKKFTGERDPDLDASFTEGSESNPMFRIERPRLLDPLESINKGLTNVMRSTAMEDYKIQGVEHYIAEFGDLMNYTAEEMLQNPLDALHNPNWKEGMDAGRLAAAKNTRMAVRHMLGTPSALQQKIDWTHGKMVDAIWKKFGTDKATRFSDKLVSVTKDPFVYARAFAFHTKLGLFNPVQLWLQAQTWSNLAGIAPREVLPASAAAMRMSSLRFTNDKNIISRMATMGGKELGMSQKDFIESYTAMRKTGIFNVGGEVAWRDDMFDPKMHQNAFTRTLEKGTLFFKEGERFARLSGWNVAYLQWRKANPGKVLDATDIGNLVKRTNDLTVNMIRSNNPSWQQGIFSVPTQFWSYQARLTELYLGGRLSNAEKIRMFAAHSALYGVPVAGAAVTGVYPWHEEMRQEFLERGIDVNNPATSAMLSGIPSTLLKGLTGKNYNFGDRYGPGGLNFIKEIARDEKGFVELLGGASASIIMDAAATASPAWAGTVNYMLGREGPALTVSDFSRAFSTVSSVNQLNKAYHMVTVGKYLTKNGVNLGDADNWDAAAMLIFGVSNQDVPDTFLRIDSMKDFEAEKKSAFKEYSRHVKSFLNATNHEDKMTYLKNARVFMDATDLLPKERAQWIHNAFKNVDVVDKVTTDFWQKSPMFQREQRLRQTMADQAEEAARKAKEE